MLQNFVLCILTIASHFIRNTNELTCACQPCDNPNQVCRVGPNGWCFKLVHVEDDGEEYEKLGCLNQTLKTIPTECLGNLVPTLLPRAIGCCKDGDFCNEFLEPAIHHAKTLPPPVKDFQPEMIGLAIAVPFLSALVIFCLVWYSIRRRKRSNKPSKEEEHLTEMKDYNGFSSGSGAGATILTELTIGKEVQLKEVIGRGRFGEVWRGLYRGEEVAVKELSTVEDENFQNENKIYKHLGSHENILKFIMPDIISRNAGTRMIIVMAYHHNRSLHEYLNSHVLDLSTFLKMSSSILNGLCYIHADIRGIPTFGKPSIAHRDLKSKNILVKADLTCCICDFGLAVSEVDYNPDSLNFSVGTIRYMSPEILSQTINRRYFNSLLKSDMYSVSLVFWEMLRRCDACGGADDYQLPYYDEVSTNPSMEDMKKVVLRVKPNIDPRWQQNPILKSFTSMMAECWNCYTEFRISADRFRLTFKKSIYDNTIK